MTKIFSLNPAGKIFEGNTHYIFSHPENFSALIKIRKNRSSNGSLLRPSKFIFGDYREWFYFYKHYLILIKRSGNLPSYLVCPKGFVKTNLGIGFVVEKICNHSGEISSTLDSYIRSSDADLDLILNSIEDFFYLSTKDKSFFHDISLVNIVVCLDEFLQIDRLVAVDGFGEGTLIKLRTYSNFFYNSWVVKVKKRLKLEAVALFEKHH
jgi:hypothetical protein